MLILKESFPTKRFKSHDQPSTTSRFEPTLYISEQSVGFEVPDKSTIDHPFRGFTGRKEGNILFNEALNTF